MLQLRAIAQTGNADSKIYLDLRGFIEHAKNTWHLEVLASFLTATPTAVSSSRSSFTPLPLNTEAIPGKLGTRDLD